MMILPCAFWPLAEHAEFGQNCFDASIGSVSVCIYDSMPIDACLFKPSFPFHRIVGSYQVLQVREAPDPTPRVGEVRIRVEASGINFADLLARMGLYPDPPKIPCVVGYEVAGRA